MTEADKTNMCQKINEFVTNCNGEQVRLVPDLCK